MELTALLSELARLSQIAGARQDYVQGGGGNTSVKLGNGLMAIKASGFRLSQVTEDGGFAVVETDTLKNVTSEFAAGAGAGNREESPRPSVEAGFHALLGTYVLHTHPVYANLALCSEEGLKKLPELMRGIPFISVPYVNPGEELCEAIKARIQPDTRVVFLQNHGVAVSAETTDEVLRLHDEINDRIAKAYGVTPWDYLYFARELNKTLYPDQQVYLTLTDAQREIQAAVMFIQFILMRNGGVAQSMDGDAIHFIANWESEQYRKSILS